MVQGTATDAVLLDGQQQPPVLLAKAKVPTTADVLTGIAAALRQLQQQRPSGLTAVQAVFLGTTQFVNAVVQRQGLAKVFVVRLCGTATKALPPFLGIPADLQAAVVAGYLLAAGMARTLQWINDLALLQRRGHKPRCMRQPAGSCCMAGHLRPAPSVMNCSQSTPACTTIKVEWKCQAFRAPREPPPYLGAVKRQPYPLAPSHSPKRHSFQTNPPT